MEGPGLALDVVADVKRCRDGVRDRLSVCDVVGDGKRRSGIGRGGRRVGTM